MIEVSGIERSEALAWVKLGPPMAGPAVSAAAMALPMIAVVDSRAFRGRAVFT